MCYMHGPAFLFPWRKTTRRIALSDVLWCMNHMAWYLDWTCMGIGATVPDAGAGEHDTSIHPSIYCRCMKLEAKEVSEHRGNKQAMHACMCVCMYIHSTWLATECRAWFQPTILSTIMNGMTWRIYNIIYTVRHDMYYYFIIISSSNIMWACRLVGQLIT